MEDMTEAVIEMIRAYWEGERPENTEKQLDKKPKYVKKYFDKFEESQFGDKTEVNEWL